MSNAWGYARPYWNRSLSPCPACGLWEALDYAEHWRYTGDEAFLREQALPALEGAADFILDYVFDPGDGSAATGPSVSPENAFMAADGRHYASVSPAFEVSMVRAVIDDLAELRAAAGVPEDGRLARLLALRNRLPQPRVLSDGTLAEWFHDLPPLDPQHRHLSHLAALYPLGQLGPEQPELALAARRSIERRLSPYEQWEDTGWARSMLLLYAARLRDGEWALWHLREMIARLMNPAGKIMHPSTRGAFSFAPVWELDGNTGAAMGITEMLLQSHGGVIRLLPALPKAWDRGSFRELVCRGGVRVSLSWREGKPDRLRLLSERGGGVTVCFGTVTQRIFPEAGRPLELTWKEHGFV